MKQKIYSLLLLALFGMTGAQAWADDLNTTEIDGVAYYEIGSAADLVAFAELVNGGEFGANAILTADIDMTGIAWEAPIAVITGEENKDVGPGAYTGIFDGQGHKISGFVAEGGTPGHIGLFGDANGATIKNFSISGKLTATGGHGFGVIAYPANSTITGVHSSLEVIVEGAGVCHVGGVVGSARGGNTITGCTFNGTLTVAVGNHDCFGGIVGYGGDNISFCANYGTITFDDGGCYAGGITGYLNNADTYIKNCLNIGSLIYNYPEGTEEAGQTPKYASAIVGRLRSHDQAKMTGNCWLEGSARGAGINDSGADDLTLAFCFPPDLLPTGEVCYKLNGDQTIIGWYQTLLADEQPTLDASHAKVYMNGRKHCNGDLYDGYTFTNEPTEIIQDEHDMVNGMCSYCGFYDEDVIAASMVLNADGYYEISNPAQLKWFSKFVNAGNFDANAILTADIDLSKVISANNTWTAIGDWGGVSKTSNACYKGHFDGQGHTITGFNATSTHNYYGIFGVASSGALIENFTIYGEMKLGHKTGGVVGYTRDATPTIRNIHSYLRIYCTEAATTALRPGGILGTANNGTTIVENCIYSDTIFVGGRTGNIGGIIGYVNNSTSAIVNITNCLFNGAIYNGNSDGQCGGIIGYSNSGKVTIKNCLSLGIIVTGEGNDGMIIGRLNGSNTKWDNNYYIGDDANINGTLSGKTASGPEPILTNEDELASGEIAWLLNEKKFLDVAWRQTLEVDSIPVPTGKGDIVYEFVSGYENIDNSNVSAVISNAISEETSFIENEVDMAYQALVTEFKNTLISWESMEDAEEFIASYRAAMKLKESILKSASNYVAYVNACEAAYADSEQLEGEWATFIKNYLEQNLEPSNDYPNGSYLYIIETMNLNDEALTAEIAFVNQMLENAIAGGITSGTEITRLMVNPNFADGFNGWTTEHENGVELATGGTTSVMRLARGLGNGTFDISQTMNELPNGIYMLSLNAMFRSGNPENDGGEEVYYNQFYAGQLYLNGTSNYVMSPGEDVIPQDDAVNKVNCYTDTDLLYSGEVDGYVPTSMVGCSYAFNAGRYQNFCAVEVTDGVLKIGVRNLSTGLGDWLPFGNIHITYLGTAEEANDDLADVLAGYVDRANTIIDFYWSDDPSDYFRYPNISTALITQLNDAVAAVEGAETGEKKMQLINTFSDLFNQVYTQRKAYIAMLEAANRLPDFLDGLENMGIITSDEDEQWQTKIIDAQDHFTKGDVSTEEALAIAGQLNIVDQLILIPNVDGVYQIATPDQLRIFALLVKNGENKAKAVLTADIDLSEVEDFEPIGTTSNPFMGEFDGQNHKITNFGQFIVDDEETGEGYYTLSFSTPKDSNGGGGEGFFGIISNATVKNFSIDGAFEVTGGYYKGVIGQAWKSTVSNVHSAMNIAITVSGCHHCGGLVGSSEGGSGSTITNCSFSGTLTIAAGSTDNFAAILGYSGGDAVINCANYGKVIFSDAGCAAGGIVGYINNTTTYVQNCLNVGTVQCTVSNSPKYGGAIVGRIKNNWNAERVTNNYWLAGNAYAPSKKDDGSAPLAASATGETAEQLASGEICYALNGDQEEIVWFQTLPNPQDETVVADPYPVLFGDHLVVFPSVFGGYTNNEADEISDIPSVEQPAFVGIYNLAGQRLDKMQKGINIVNGKKMLVK